jgi:hypothetical protein
MLGRKKVTVDELVADVLRRYGVAPDLPPIPPPEAGVLEFIDPVFLREIIRKVQKAERRGLLVRDDSGRAKTYQELVDARVPEAALIVEHLFGS